MSHNREKKSHRKWQLFSDGEHDGKSWKEIGEVYEENIVRTRNENIVRSKNLKLKLKIIFLQVFFQKS